jgi:RNA methyltransferase, TrmH family
MQAEEFRPAGDIIRSPQNSLIKQIRSLGTRKTRESERAIVLDGARLVGAALDAGVAPRAVVLAESAMPEARVVAARCGAVARLADDRVVAALTDTVHSQGIVAIVDEPEWGIPDVVDPLVVLLDQVADPGNLGTIVRTAAAAGADAIVVGPGCVDPFGAKAMRAGMGAQFLVPVLAGSSRDVRLWLEAAVPVRWLADASAERSYSDDIWQGGVGIIVGSEARGATEWGRRLATGGVSIPIHERVESLNAAVAAGVLLFEAARHRHTR